MFGTTNFRTVQRSASRTRSNSKPAAYFAARAMDEALGGLLRSNSVPTLSGKVIPLLAQVACERFWYMGGCSTEAGKNGGFQFSIRELTRIVGNEEMKTRGGKTKVDRGPDEGFDQLVRQSWEKLQHIVEAGPDAIPDEYFYRLRWWNETNIDGYAMDCPNPKRDEEINIPANEIIEKKNDTVAWIEYLEPSDEDRVAMHEVLRDNLLTKEEIDAYEYRIPVKLYAGIFYEETDETA